MLPSYLYTTSLNVLIKIIIEYYFSHCYCITFITDDIFYNIDNYNKTIIIIRPDDTKFYHQILNTLDNGCTDFIIHMKQPEIFIKTYDKAKHYSIQRKSYRKLIFLLFNNDINELINFKEMRYVFNVLFVKLSKKNNKYKNNCEVYNLLTHEIVDDESKTQIHLDQWTSCTEQFDRNTNLFPYMDLNDLKGRTVRLATLHYVPFSVLNFDKFKKVQRGRDGVEVKIIEEFCILAIVRDNHEWGEVYNNYTGIGVLGNIAMDNADMGVGGLYLGWYEAYGFLDFSIPSIRSEVKCLVPTARLAPTWELPWLPFSKLTWVVLIFTYLFSSVVLFQVKKYGYQEFGLLTTQSQVNLDQSWMIRRITGWLLLTGLVIDNAYSAGLAFTYTVPKYEKPIDSMEDIVDRKLEWGSTHQAWIFSIRLSEQDLTKSLLSLYRVYSKEELIKKSFTRDMGFVLEVLQGGTISLPEHITLESLNNLSLMKHKLYYERCVVMLRKNSPYTKKMNEFIGKLSQAGLLKAWEFQMALKYLPLKDQLAAKYSKYKKDSEEYSALHLNKIIGVFALYSVGVVLSVMLFLLEVCYNRHLKKLFHQN